MSFVVSFHCRRRWSKCCCPCRWGLLAPVYPMLTVGARAASQGVAGGKQKTRDVARCGELDDLVFEGFGGAICCGRSTDPSCHSYDPALSMSLSIPFPMNLRDPSLPPRHVPSVLPNWLRVLSTQHLILRIIPMTRRGFLLALLNINAIPREMTIRARRDG